MRSLRTLTRGGIVAAVFTASLFAATPAHASTGTIGPVRAASCAWGDFNGSNAVSLSDMVVAYAPNVAAHDYRGGIVDTGTAVVSFAFYNSALTQLASNMLWTRTTDNAWSSNWNQFGTNSQSTGSSWIAGSAGSSQPIVYVYVTVYFYNSAGSFTGSTGYWAYNPTAGSYNCNGGSATFFIQ